MAVEKEIEAKLKALLATLGKRPATVLRLLLEKGTVSTYDLGQLGYDQPPRAAQDLKDVGVLLRRTSGRHPTSGSRMAIYALADEQPYLMGAMKGRQLFPKAFRLKMISHYGAKSAISGVTHDPSELQIDHRIPYQVAGDAELTVEHHMLLSGSEQRRKSWACEHCPNFVNRNKVVCQTCYWAFPESQYDHVATIQEYRVEVVFRGPEEAKTYAALKKKSDQSGATVSIVSRDLLITFLNRE